MVLLVNQHTIPVYVDIVNAFAEKRLRPILFTGNIKRGEAPLLDSIRVINSKSYNRTTTLSRLLSWLIFSIHYFCYLLFCRKPDLVLVSTNPPLAPIITAFISRLRNIPFHVVLYDLYPDALSQAGLVGEGNLLFRLWQRANRTVFSRAGKVFTLSESMKNASLAYVINSEKVSIIHNWADTTYVRPIPKRNNKFISKHGLENDFIVLYSGNMGLTHDLESLIEAAEILKGLSGVKFILIGDGGKKKVLTRLTSEKNLTNVVFLPYQDAETFPLAMASADIGVVTLGHGAEGISVPSKTYINLAAGVCLLSIAPLNSELSRLITETSAGVICEPGKPDQVASAIKALIERPQELDHHKRMAAEAAKSFTPLNAYRYVSESGLLKL